MLRYTTDRARPGLVALYDIWSGNGEISRRDHVSREELQGPLVLDYYKLEALLSAKKQ